MYIFRENVREVGYVALVTPTVGLRLFKSSFLPVVIFWSSSMTHQDNCNVFLFIWRLLVVISAAFIPLAL